ncbi:hypothetical protein [Oceanicoccus sp. KOV_DT_Chl]|uniref:hypothetical protein n=1 Tax=Oceanicoccus sp. KOV_DT_Chl TaxID=1904639 RepID=UPI0011AF17B8|nr:hypothetical protein [Oceanicoccus sp. KOV_DT_Chl]
MRSIYKLTIAISILIFNIGCATTSKYEQVDIDKHNIPTAPVLTKSTIYSTSFFQERFMGFRPIFGSTIWWDAVVDYENENISRLESSEYEKILSEFNVGQYLENDFKEQSKSSQSLIIKLSSSENESAAIVSMARCGQSASCSDPVEAELSNTAAVAAFKYSYGLAMRFGKEQFGFVKTYRPFIRIMGVAIDAETNKPLWSNAVVVFGEKPYKGSDSNAENINSEELVSTFKSISQKANSLIIDSLNGDDLGEMPVLHGLTDSDFEF